MNNVIFILVDSVFSDCIGNRRTKESSTPFIDSLIKESIFAPSVYSFGPYTDAATKGLYTGSPTLNDYGYFFGINSSNENHFKTFKENGYETYGFYYPYYLLGSKVAQYLDHSIYIGGFVYSSEWNGKFKYYADIQKERNLSEIEYSLLKEHIVLMFDCWKSFYNDLINKDFSKDILSKIVSNDKVLDCLKKLDYEIKLFNDNQIGYIDELLEQGLSHHLNSIDDFSYSKLINKDFINDHIYRKNKKFFKKVENAEFTSNFLKTLGSMNNIFNKRELGSYILSMFSTKYMKSLSMKDNWQYSASMNCQIRQILKLIDSRKDASEPFYISMHSEEPHNYVAYFSYDSNDDQEIAEEIEYLYPLVLNRGKKFKGNLDYQLSLRYTDLCIKRLFKGLNDRGLLDSTTVIITSDHGSSYTFNPIRECVVNNFYNENYRTPLIIWSKNLNKDLIKTYEGMYSAKDTLATICDVCGFNKPEQYEGIPIYKNEGGRPYVISEYMGPGVPDMLHRDAWICIRDESYVIAYKIPIYVNFDKSYCVELYDIKKDLLQRKNLVKSNKISNNHIDFLNDIVSKRFEEIKQRKDAFLTDLHRNSK